MYRLAVVGAGRMGHVRTQAFLQTGRAVLCGVAAQHLESARQFGRQYGCTQYFDDFRELSQCNPDLVLIETPHRIQEDVIRWALTSGFHTLIGGCPARSTEEARWIAEISAHNRLIVEAGFEARYKNIWTQVKIHLQTGRIGELVAVRAVSLFLPDPASWYYDQEESGGMPLTHMTYAFINPLRWLLGEPLFVSAFANRKKHLAATLVQEETCVANILFPDNILCSLTSGYIRTTSQENDSSWHLVFLGTHGEIHLFPSDEGPGELILYKDGQSLRESFPADKPFQTQAETFLNDLEGAANCLNTPSSFLGDIVVAEAIAHSARQLRTIAITDTATQPAPCLKETVNERFI